MPFAGSFFLCKVGDSNETGRKRRSTVGDCGADFGVQIGAGGESDFLTPSMEPSDRLTSDQMPENDSRELLLKHI